MRRIANVVGGPDDGSIFVTDYGMVALPPKLAAEVARINAASEALEAYLEGQRTQIERQWERGDPLVLADLK